MDANSKRRPLEEAPQSVPAGGNRADGAIITHPAPPINAPAQEAQRADEDLCAHVALLFDEPGNVVELRALGVNGKYVVSGYFTQPEDLVAAARKLDGNAAGIFVTLNPVRPELLARADNRVVKPVRATSDDEIVRRRWLLIDNDSVRAPGISASDAEKGAAFALTQKVRAYLESQGFPDPVQADSGNGGHLLYRIDRPAGDGGLIQRVLQSLAFRFDTEAARVDQLVYNPARISKLYGTLVKKGDNTPERPHRRSRLIEVPERIAVVPSELLEKVAAQAPPESQSIRLDWSAEAFDLEVYLAQHGVEVVRSGPWQNGKRWVLAACPFNAAHTDRSAYVVQFANGAIAAGCHHNGCVGKGWHELRDAVEPGWRNAAKSPGTRPTRQISEYKPFPIDVLPSALSRFITAASKALGCDPSFIALPLLAAIGATIGTTRRIKLKNSWREFPILWTVLIARSGLLKSPALDIVLRPLRTRQARAMKKYGEELQTFLAEHNRYLSEHKEWHHKGRKAGAPQPKAPKKPVCEQVYVEDTTVEALAVVLDENRRGVLLARDELSGWFGSFNQYKATKRADEAHWLNMFGGRAMKVNRKGGDLTTIFVPTAAVSVTGTIQPKILRRALGAEHFENGIAPRLLMVMPPIRPRRWTDDDLDPALEREIEQLIERFLEIPQDVWESGKPRPVDIPLDSEAKALFVAFVNELGQEQMGLDDELAAAWSKLEGYAARLALIVHMTRWATGDPSLASAERIDAQSMAAGIALSRWFSTETKRVYAVLGESDEEAATRQKVESIQAMGGSVSIRDWQQRRSFGSSEDAESDLESLVMADLGRWENPRPGPRGGRPSKVFSLVPKTKTPTDDAQEGVLSVSVLSEGVEVKNDGGAEDGPRDAVTEGGGADPTPSGSDRTPLPTHQGGVLSGEPVRADHGGNHPPGLEEGKGGGSPGVVVVQPHTRPSDKTDTDRTPSAEAVDGVLSSAPCATELADSPADPHDKTDTDKTPSGAAVEGVLFSGRQDPFVQKVLDLFSGTECHDDGSGRG